MMIATRAGRPPHRWVVAVGVKAIEGYPRNGPRRTDCRVERWTRPGSVDTFRLSDRLLVARREDLGLIGGAAVRPWPRRHRQLLPSRKGSPPAPGLEL